MTTVFGFGVLMVTFRWSGRDLGRRSLAASPELLNLAAWCEDLLYAEKIAQYERKRARITAAT
jgi:predicted metal-dependent HD superfamily phosphohydrolase